MILVREYELQHYGVLGMKWGRRKAKKGGVYKDPGRMAKNEIKRIKSMKSQSKLFNFIKDNYSEFKAGYREGYNWVQNNQEVFQTTIREANDFLTQESIRQATNASLQAASLGCSGGTNPFMFGVM